ncbi:MAG: hypothetical protein CMH56_16340 [Myxococcales bacterium]|nr:hypothetical protein [Myxococcales bacterium]
MTHKFRIQNPGFIFFVGLGRLGEDPSCQMGLPREPLKYMKYMGKIIFLLACNGLARVLTLLFDRFADYP